MVCTFSPRRTCPLFFDSLAPNRFLSFFFFFSFRVLTGSFPPPPSQPSRPPFIFFFLFSGFFFWPYQKRTSRPPFAKQISMLHDVAHGVAYLHSRRPGIIHRDLKSQNILVSRSQRAKINDFGLARIVPKASTLLHTQCGTPNWQAPEMWASNPSYTEKVDVYACGLICKSRVAVFSDFFFSPLPPAAFSRKAETADANKQTNK
ncbi:MAG: kinase-like domain-containing protein [Olpidium bornovanus]|uniref:Kinase-like domain-containing protein n=1 Tax=Olpidium bornovanus TaxID=278681 RepID=A0A8H7ZLA4_9FUNG|nr:MAG: kinase-like domain-containing protein [Olpidium bornovanus]